VENVMNPATSEEISLRFQMERFNIKQVHGVEGEEQCLVEVSNRFAALGKFDAEVEISTM
jgi:hypothetical protein